MIPAASRGALGGRATGLNRSRVRLTSHGVIRVSFRTGSAYGAALTPLMGDGTPSMGRRHAGGPH